MTAWLEVQLYTWEVSGSNLSLEMGYPGFPQSLQENAGATL
jgi:hypothetical protein